MNMLTLDMPPKAKQKARTVAHAAVMTDEVIKGLGLKAGQCVVDCTLGLGGHALVISKILGPEGRLIAIDRDSQSLRKAKTTLASCFNRCDFIHEDFRNIDRVLDRLGVPEVDAILFDLGISSFQLDDPTRGFSFQTEGPLDMRMDPTSPISAYDLVNSLSQGEIAKILKEYGQERFAGRIARHIVSSRPIDSTAELSRIVLKAIPRKGKWQKIHPATRTFQAIRIAVNRELEALETALDKSIKCLKPHGRLCVIAFHSLEDRIVKIKFKQYAKGGHLQLMTKKPIRPSLEETQNNPRSRSARLRIAERT